MVVDCRALILSLSDTKIEQPAGGPASEYRGAPASHRYSHGPGGDRAAAGPVA